MINDRLIDPDSLVVAPGRASVDVRIPWYRAIPASCIADVTFTVDGDAPPAESVLCRLNGTERRLEEFPGLVDESWFTTDSLTVSGDMDVTPDEDHEVDVELKLYIPYIITAHGVLMIDERRSTTMKAVTR